MPILKLPIHTSYILYLAKFSRLAAKMYFWKAIQLCRLFRLEPSLLLHPLDFMGKEDDTDLSFFPAMDLRVDYKLSIVNEVLGLMQKHYQLVPMREHAKLAGQRSLGERDVSMVRPAVS